MSTEYWSRGTDTSHAWAAPGDYPVQLTGFSDSYPGGISAIVLVHVAGAEVYYENGANATPAPPYATWATAATNIQDAIDAGTQIGRSYTDTNATGAGPFFYRVGVKYP